MKTVSTSKLSVFPCRESLPPFFPVPFVLSFAFPGRSTEYTVQYRTVEYYLCTGIIMDEHGVTEYGVKEAEGGEDGADENGHNVVVTDHGVASDSEQPTKKYISHFRNDIHPVYVRYGVPLFLVITLILLINAHVGSGVSAEYLLLRDGQVEEQQVLLAVSIFSSVTELWHNGSYPLAILIVLTSVMWPYVKLFVAFFVWFTPYQRPRRRELLLEVIDAVGKWSFVDIIVLDQIMVAFRSSIRLATTVTLEIVVLAEWGFYVFVLATMMSLVGTHYILHRHRQVHYHCKKEPTETPETKVSLKERGRLGKHFVPVAVSACVIAFVCFLVGCLVDTYQVTNSRGDVSFSVDYSIVSVGRTIPKSQLEPNGAGTRFLQFMWFFLGVAMPLWATFLFGFIFAVPLSSIWAERIFIMGEVAFVWSCAEVLLVSSVFAVLQMPTFGDGLIEADCDACFIIDTKILGPFSLFCVGTVMSVTVNIWLYRKAHGIVYGD